MPIKTDHSTMPVGKAQTSGWEPDENPIFGRIVIDSLIAEKGKREAKVREYISPSDAYTCARALSYKYAGIAGEEMDDSGWNNVRLGTLIHDDWGPRIKAHFGDDVDVEYLIGTRSETGEIIPRMVTVRGVEIPVVAFLDIWLHTAEINLVTDLKSIGGVGYKMAIGAQGSSEGPKRAALIQAGIGALIVEQIFEAENMLVSVTDISKEAISVRIAKSKGYDSLRRFTAEWTVPLDEIRTEVEDEMLRMWNINRLVHEEGLAARRLVRIDSGKVVEIESPKTGGWQVTEMIPDTEGGEPVLRLIDTGTAWNCSYCSQMTRCASDGPGRVPVEIKVAGDA